MAAALAAAGTAAAGWSSLGAGAWSFTVPGDTVLRGAGANPPDPFQRGAGAHPPGDSFLTGVGPPPICTGSGLGKNTVTGTDLGTSFGTAVCKVADGRGASGAPRKLVAKTAEGSEGSDGGAKTGCGTNRELFRERRCGSRTASGQGRESEGVCENGTRRNPPMLLLAAWGVGPGSTDGVEEDGAEAGSVSGVEEDGAEAGSTEGGVEDGAEAGSASGVEDGAADA